MITRRSLLKWTGLSAVGAACGAVWSKTVHALAPKPPRVMWMGCKCQSFWLPEKAVCPRCEHASCVDEFRTQPSAPRFGEVVLACMAPAGRISKVSICYKGALFTPTETLAMHCSSDILLSDLIVDGKTQFSSSDSIPMDAFHVPGSIKFDRVSEGKIITAYVENNGLTEQPFELTLRGPAILPDVLFDT